MLDRTIIKRIWVTEKSMAASGTGKYTFLVEQRATKNEIKKLVKELYKVDVVDVNVTVRKPVKTGHGRLAGKTGPQKKAIVTLKAGQTIVLQ